MLPAYLAATIDTTALDQQRVGQSRTKIEGDVPDLALHAFLIARPDMESHELFAMESCLTGIIRTIEIWSER